MVSKRSRFVSESTTDEDSKDMEYMPDNQNKPPRKPTRVPKCFTKNALMARENRLKKKMYINTLENQVDSLKAENKNLNTLVENQSCKIDELCTQIKYLKSVISNSEDIGKLIRAINCAGMTVTTSIDEMGNRSPVSSSKPVSDAPVDSYVSSSSSKTGTLDMSRHPWEERSSSPYLNYPTPDSTKSYYSGPEFEELNNEGLLLDMDIPLEMNEDLLDIIDENVLESPPAPEEDHSYHTSVKIEQDSMDNGDDVGVCLHVRKNKVSLEFCPSCSDSALESWQNV